MRKKIGTERKETDLDIKGFIPFSLVDWDGCISSVIFLPNCTFRCGYCYNRELVLEPQNIDSVPLDDILGYLRKHRDVIDGVVITGGEPTVHNDLGLLCSELKSLGLKVKVDTNGTDASHIVYLVNRGRVDYVAMDIKGDLTNRCRYSELAGIKISNYTWASIKVMVSYLKDMNFISPIGCEFRTTVTSHSVSEIESIAREISGKVPYFLQPFKAGVSLIDNRYSSIMVNDDLLEEMCEVANRYVETKIRK